MADQIRQAGVVGLGVMGFDIAFLYAMKGYPTLAYDASAAAMAAIGERREQTIERLKRRDRISENEVENVRRGLVAASGPGDLARADLVTEAVFEAAEAKLAVYAGLKRCGFNGILTTNTSSLTRASLLAPAAYEAKRFASTHFFNPVLYTQMVEVVRGDMEEKSFRSMLAFLRSLGRAPAETRDISGFVSNSILMYYAVMALRLLEGGAPFEEIDQAAKELRLPAPFVSLDSWKPRIVEDVTRAMFRLRGDEFLRSSKLLGELARSNPKFYVEQRPNPEIYAKLKAAAERPGAAAIRRALKISLLVAAARVVELGEDPQTVDRIATDGLKMPQAPLREIDGTGPEAVLEELKRLNREMPDAPLAPPELLARMAREGESFYRGEEPNPRVAAFLRPKGSDARH
ncbi:MAG TPA: 3-hydroxyacyl-CoA dehydrogenase NAD-binding domain-containing protein [Candidatus Acidoferrales bacterium]|nr:3-hydroxyacyl-CoA dehydrogenase NAD-binding domain-containing protein [Candidatus Acidoferrales bacterium]